MPENPPTSTANSTKKKTLIEGLNLSTASSSETSSEDAAREALALLRSAGVHDATEVLRAGALAMVRRSLDDCEARHKGAGYLRRMVMNGGPWAQTPGRAESPSELLRAMGMVA